MNEVSGLVGFLGKREKLVAMLAPSFPVVYSYPEIISRLRRSGFTRVVEVSVGARKTNEALVDWVRRHPGGRLITAPCPSLVRLVKAKYPQLVKYLAQTVDSPMVATAKVLAEKFPGHRPVFIGPCVVKKLESADDHPDLDILVLTYKELDEVFRILGIAAGTGSPADRFDLEEPSTRLYPVSGGLAQSSGVRELFAEDEVQVVSGITAVTQALTEFETNTKVRLLDILFCEGGCINGPGVVSSLKLPQRQERIGTYWKEAV